MDLGSSSDSEHFGPEDYARLYGASIQKFLTYSIIGSATFVGYVQLALALHSSGPYSFGGSVLLVVVLVLLIVVLFTALAAARQYFLIATLHGSNELRLRGLENKLTGRSSRLIQWLTQAVHAFDWSSTKKEFKSNALFFVVSVIWAVAGLVLLFALG